MPELVSFPVDADNAVLVEVEVDDGVGDGVDGPEIGPASRAGDLIRSATTSFDGALANVRAAASVTLASFRDMEVGPDEIQLEFGLKLNAQAGAVIAKTGVDGHLQVTLTWRRAAQPDPADQPDPASPAGAGAGQSL